MARINRVINAFNTDELQVLTDVLEHEEKRAEKAGIKLPDLFQELRCAISMAFRYANGQEHKSHLR